MKRFLNNIYLTVKTIENLHTFLFDYMNLLKGEVIYKIRNTPYRLIARSGTADKEEIIAVMSGFEYRCDVLPKIHNPIIFDVGAYIGDSAIYMSAYFKKKCKIYSFEPDEENFKYCLLNTLLNDMDNITCSKIAIGSKNGVLFLQRKDKPSDAYYLENKKTADSTSCSTKSLMQVAKELNISIIDILKMDVEGGEYAIFNSAPSYSYIKKSVRYILLEYHYDFGEKLVHDLLQKLQKDFKVLHHRDNLICFANNKLNR